MQVKGFDAVRCRLEIGHVAQLIVREVQAETITERLDRVLAHLLELVVDVLAFACFAHAEAFHGFRQDDRRPAGVAHGGGVGVVDLLRVMAAARQPPDVVIAQVTDQRLQLGVFTEEMLSHIGAILGLVVLIIAIDALHHPLA